MDSDKRPILGYWAIRGRAQIPRLLFAYVGQEFENKVYSSPQQWFSNDKNNLGLNFPNLPYLVVGDFRVTQSNAISKYIINQSGQTNLLGKTNKQIAIIDQIVGVIDDLSSTALSLAFNPNFETEKNKIFQDKVQQKVIQIVKLLGDKDWILGYLSFADFKLAQAINYFEGIWGNYYEHYPTLQKLKNRFNDLPQIKDYYLRQDATKAPFLPPTAKWH